MRSWRMVRGAMAATAMLVSAGSAMAATWPDRSILAVSPFSAGNANDLVARIVLDQVSRELGQTIIIENRPGGGGSVGAASVAKASPDGYTVLLYSSSLSSQVVLHRALPFDPVKDFEPSVLFGVQPSVLVTTPERGWKSVADLVAAAKAKPGSLNYGSAGVGSASHMAAERLRLAAHIDVQHIPFRGPTEAFTELLGGRLDFYFLPIAPALPNIKNKKVVALAVSTPKRASLLPGVPTVAEAGYPTAKYLFWGGVAFPAKTPRAIVDKMHDATEKVLAMPAIQEKLANLGVQPDPMNVDQFTKFVHDDVAGTVQLAKDIKLVPTD